MADNVKAGLTLPWLWVAVVIAYLALGFMLPPWDGSLKELAKAKISDGSSGGQNEKADEIVF